MFITDPVPVSQYEKSSLKESECVLLNFGTGAGRRERSLLFKLDITLRIDNTIFRLYPASLWLQGAAKLWLHYHWPLYCDIGHPL
tara:strand:- start:3305 stop:3559 length:255 start_codon:yes stop_codon:yes gene_type:complete